MFSNFKIENLLSKTLLFLITAILILIILVLGLIVYNETAASMQENIINTQLSIKSVVTVIEEYKKDKGEYPKSLDQLKGIYLTKIPEDIWGNPYIYEYLEGNIEFSFSDPNDIKRLFQIFGINIEENPITNLLIYRGKIDLTFEDGMSLLGPLPIGRAPKLK